MTTRKIPASVDTSVPTDDVLAGIREAITRQRLPPGSKLHEEALAGIFGVSRTRIRQALQRLQHTGLVSSGRKQIARVAEPSVKDARDMFAVRRLVEPAVAADVARRVTLAIRNSLQKLLDSEQRARDRDNRMEAVRLAGEFHVALADIAGNAVIARLIREIVDRTFLVIFMYQAPSPGACVQAEHSSLLKAIGEGDAKGAAQSMLQHIESIESRMSLKERAEPSVDLTRAFTGIVDWKA